MERYVLQCYSTRARESYQRRKKKCTQTHTHNYNYNYVYTIRIRSRSRVYRRAALIAATRIGIARKAVCPKNGNNFKGTSYILT